LAVGKKNEDVLRYAKINNSTINQAIEILKAESNTRDEDK
jgi:hypothetical protein